MLQIFRVGGDWAPSTASASVVHDRLIGGTAVTPARHLVGPSSAAWTLHVPIGAWSSGLYAARLIAPDGAHTYALFVLRPSRLGSSSRVLIVEPTNTWQAYNYFDGDSWYENAAVHEIALDRPYIGNGLPVRDAYDLGFLRWFARSGHSADFISDDDLDDFTDAAQLRRLYGLIVFPGHEEYVTGHVYDLIEGFRDRGGNLAFLSADNFFYRVEREGPDELLGRTRWRDLGRPEAALVGAEYVGWDERLFPNRPYHVASVSSAPWFFAGSGLHDGSTFGNYGIEIDGRTADSPPGTVTLARIPNAFGPGMTAEMTFYRRGRAMVFDAGVMNFGASADWPTIDTLMDNLWNHLAR